LDSNNGGTRHCFELGLLAEGFFSDCLGRSFGLVRFFALGSGQSSSWDDEMTDVQKSVSSVSRVRFWFNDDSSASGFVAETWLKKYYAHTQI